MRTKIGLTIVMALGIAGFAGATRRKVEPKAGVPVVKAGERLIVHEWGTFTNFSTSDGTQLKFRPLLDQLPEFIHQSKRLFPFMLTKGDVLARQRMETPVTYFYSDRPRQVDVRVGFPQGLLTEFYPPAREEMPTDFGESMELSHAALSWRVKLHPAGELAKKANQNAGEQNAVTLPPVKGDDHYGFARETDSAIVEVSDSQGQSHYEKFLFYRGLGDFSLPLRLEASPGRRFRAINDGPDEIYSLFLVMIDDDGLRFCRHPKITAHGTLDMVVPESLATADELSDQMAEALTSAGLYEKEARAMVHTWRSSWFSEPGARLFYIVPRRLTDEILPLVVQPTPDQVVRVLVGRMEVLTPETTERLVAVIRDHGDCQPDDVEPLRRELSRLGRFAESALGHLSACQTDPATREAIGRVTKIARQVP